jgi:hypothetical protein
MALIEPSSLSENVEQLHLGQLDYKTIDVKCEIVLSSNSFAVYDKNEL